MTRTIDARELPWIAATPQRPRCDVPWLGNVTIAEDGNVQFCCYSPAFAGNVTERPFAEVWNGAVMQRIRSTLAAGDFPPECRTPSCPILRGDENHFIRERMEECTTGWKEIVPVTCRGTIDLPPRCRIGERLVIDVGIEGAAPDAVVDVVAAFVLPDGSARFLPDLGTTPLPFEQGVAIGGGASQRLRLLDQVVSPGTGTGRHALLVALFAQDSSLLAATHCRFAMTAEFDLDP